MVEPLFQEFLDQLGGLGEWVGGWVGVTASPHQKKEWGGGGGGAVPQTCRNLTFPLLMVMIFVVKGEKENIFSVHTN